MNAPKPSDGLEYARVRPTLIPPVFANGVQIAYGPDDDLYTLSFAYFVVESVGDEEKEEGVEVAKIVMSSGGFEAFISQVADFLEVMAKDDEDGEAESGRED